MRRALLEGDHQTFTFGFMQLFDLTKPVGPSGSSKSLKMDAFPGLLKQSWEFGGFA